MTALAGTCIELWVESRGGSAAVNPVIGALLDELSAAGAKTIVRVPEREVIDVDDGGRDHADLVLLKSAGAVAQSLAVSDEVAGVQFLNGAAATRRAHDKAATVARLAAADLPVPLTLLATGGARLRSPMATAGAFISKPVYGIHGRGVTVHEHFPTVLDEGPASLDDLSFVVDDGVRLVQAKVGEEPDVKVYVADGRCFVAFKQFRSGSYASDEVQPSVLPDDEIEMVHAVGEALDLRCFGVDLRRQDGQTWIIDANPFPGYRGFPQAVSALRAEIEQALAARG